VRGVHLSERKVLQRWVTNERDLIEHFLLLGTSFSRQQLAEMSAIEIRSVARVVAEMTDSDLKLYPYISAFVTTSESEQLWFSKGIGITFYRDRIISLPDDAVRKFLAGLVCTGYPSRCR
jgi:hypothetical protein